MISVEIWMCGIYSDNPGKKSILIDDDLSVIGFPLIHGTFEISDTYL